MTLPPLCDPVSRDPATLEKAIVSKYFTAFLDHGPHFVLRLVIVVLSGIKEAGGRERHDTVFVLSMVQSIQIHSHNTTPNLFPYCNFFQ